MRGEGEDVRVRISVRVKKISTSIHVHFQYFYLSIFVLFFFSTCLLSIKVRRIIDPDLGPGLERTTIEFIRINFKIILEYSLFGVFSRWMSVFGHLFQRRWSKIMDFFPRWKWYKMKVLDEYRTAPMSVSLDRVPFVGKNLREDLPEDRPDLYRTDRR